MEQKLNMNYNMTRTPQKRETLIKTASHVIHIALGNIC